MEDKGNGKGENSYNKKRNNKNQPNSDSKKRKGECWFCGKPGHFKSECRSFSNKKIGASESKNKFVAVISKVNILEDANDWWIDSGAARHVCNDTSFFNTYEPVDDGTVLYMGNSSTATIKCKGTMDLEFTSGKIVSLTNVCHVREVRKNLVSRSLLNKHGFKLVFESDKFILSKGGIFVGKGYLYQGMFKLNINKINNSIYMLDSFYFWHTRLGHANTRNMNGMVKLDLIPKYDNNIGDRCKICMQTKITRMTFPKVERTTFLLELVHSDVCDMHSNPTRGGKKYFVTFIDDFSKLCYIYLLHSKDEVLRKFMVYKIEVENQCNLKIKRLRFDRGGEYHFPEYCENVGIIHETSAPYTPQ